MRCGPVIPVLRIEETDRAGPLARALFAGGIGVIEVTLRTPAAAEAIRRIRAELPQVIVAAGTVRSAAQLDLAAELGCAFAVSPGTTPRLLDAAAFSPVPLVPGIATPSEACALLERGITVAKLFPAEAAGGIRLLRALFGPFPELRFCPTGGIDPTNAAAYLALPNVLCVGGSWLAPEDAIAAGDWSRIEALARAAAALREAVP